MADYEEQRRADYYEEDYEEQQMADYYEELADYKNQQMQLQLDLKELKYLQSIAMRSRVYLLLSSEIDNVNSKVLSNVVRAFFHQFTGCFDLFLIEL